MFYESILIWKGTIPFHVYHQLRIEKNARLLWNSSLNFDIYEFLSVHDLIKNDQKTYRLYLSFEMSSEQSLIINHELIGINKNTILNKNFKLDLISYQEVLPSQDLSQIKGINRNFYIRAQQEAERIGKAQALILNSLGQVVETTFGNIFFSKNARDFVTPSLHSGCKKGIMRDFFLENQNDLGLTIAEKDINITEISNFSYAFMTNAVRIIQGIHSIDQFIFDTKKYFWIYDKTLEKIGLDFD
ncbi:MAG: aminotransferase class IV [Chitinophagales bacterium]|jgi:branched-subunit amino acid aminotransferase/4-amino-4-deoxychorismate lyase|nr:aminotransferase class IV [Chitinophagales bacterium]